MLARTTFRTRQIWMDSPDLKWNSRLVSLASSYSGKHPLSSPQPMVRTTSDTNFTDFSRIFQGERFIKKLSILNPPLNT